MFFDSSTEKFTAIVQNTESYAKNHRYIVARLVDGELWFYGAYDDEDHARTAIDEIGNGVLLFNEE